MGYLLTTHGFCEFNAAHEADALKEAGGGDVVIVNRFADCKEFDNLTKDKKFAFMGTNSGAIEIYFVDSDGRYFFITPRDEFVEVSVGDDTRIKNRRLLKFEESIFKTT